LFTQRSLHLATIGLEGELDDVVFVSDMAGLESGGVVRNISNTLKLFKIINNFKNA
jgi:hypothetical protein